jgi:DNA-directed RNA polymerase subunit F
MFVKIDKKTLQEEIINSEEMAKVLEADLKPDDVDEALTEIVSGTYEHSNAFATYKYKA